MEYSRKMIAVYSASTGDRHPAALRSTFYISVIVKCTIHTCQGCHKLGFYPSSRIFNACQSYSDGFVEVFGFLAL